MIVLAPHFARVALGLRFGALRRQAARFVAVGIANTALFLVVYLLFRTVFPATVANVLASVLTTVTGTNANGRVTFAVDGRIGLRRQLESTAVTGIGLVITTGAVGVVDTADNALGELAVLVAAGAMAGTVRFVLLRTWVFNTRRAPTREHTGRSTEARCSSRWTQLVWFATGRAKPTVAPPPSRLSANTVPPWLRTISSTIARPRPEPGSVRTSTAR